MAGNGEVTGYWWVKASNGKIAADAVRGGTEKNGDPLYIGRAKHNSELLPAKIGMALGDARISYNGEEYRKYVYEVLCTTRPVTWVTASDGDVPEGAVCGGHTDDGEKLYVGRAVYNTAVTPGKVHPSRRCCYIPYAWKEHIFQQYEVLVIR